MVSIGSSSSSTPNSGKKTSTKELVTVFGGSMLGVGVLLLGVTGIIVALPEPQTSSSMITHKKMLSPDEAAKAAHERIEKAKYQNLQKTKYHKKYSMTPLSSIEASKAARARLSKAGAEYVKFKDPVCEDERSFLIELLTDSQLYEFMEYLERDEEEDGEYYRAKTGDPAEDGCSKCGVKGDDVHGCWNCDKDLCIDCDPGQMRSDFDGHTYCDRCGPDGEYYRAETLKKNSCCCGATVINPCACMIEGVMDCSAVEPKCPCYEWPSNVNSPIELDNYESKCPRCKTDLTEEWWDEVHGEELGDWEVEEGGRAKYYRTWYGNCPSCRSYFELPDYYYDHGESMVGWEPSYIDRAESFEFQEAESYDHVATMRELVAWLNENNLEPSDIERFTPDGEVILKPLIQRAKYKEQQKKKDKDRIAKIKAWKKKNNYGPSQTIPRPVRQRMLKELSAEDGSYRDFLSGVDVPHSVTLAWANGADDWEELVYALGSELDEVSAELQRVLIANEAFYDAHFD
jgi:hypothetical protein